jgi:predicted nucleic acid-binding protein
LILLDTTVLVYAVGGEHPLRDPCREVVRDIGAGRLAATTTVEVIQEFAHVRARRTGRADARTLALRFADLLSPLVHPGEADLARGLELFERYEALGAFDAVLAAVVLERDHLVGLMSADRGFTSVAGLTHLDPVATAGP